MNGRDTNRHGIPLRLQPVVAGSREQQDQAVLRYLATLEARVLELEERNRVLSRALDLASAARVTGDTDSLDSLRAARGTGYQTVTGESC